jgi:NADH:ubiquinone oxidoreductase subunit F (NADH-binding)/(2Fe-2S) ferredoxin/NAD-dependent dihydropyrimidine dehydrogenase PreA subunit
MNAISIQELAEIREKTRASLELGEGKPYQARVVVHLGTCGISAGAEKILHAFEDLIRSRPGNGIHLSVGGCGGLCSREPMVTVDLAGEPRATYVDVAAKDVKRIFEEHVLGKRPVTEKMLPAGDPFFRQQLFIVLRNRGLVDAEKIDEYIAQDGYSALAKVLTTTAPEEVIKTIKASGLRGRGGGGFPAGVKWETCRHAGEERGEERYVICNADEGDPGAFMDRSVIESDPHAVIEGMAIGAYAIGARRGYVYIRKEYPVALEKLNIALAQARAYGLLGENIFGTPFSFDIEVHRGAGAFVCGESTALMASLEGKAGIPRAKYIHTVEYGLYNRPSCLNNVETWANVPPIINNGVEWFTRVGTGDVSTNPWGGSKGTKVFSLTGKVKNTGLIEVPMGITLREIIFNIGGGIGKGRKFKTVQTGGPSGGCLPESLLDLPVDFDSLTDAGSMMGSGGMIVGDENTCMVDLAKYFIGFLLEESCGKCVPCREGLRSMYAILDRITKGQGKEGDIQSLEDLSKVMIQSSLCALGQSAPNPVLSSLKYFREEYERHINDRKCPAGVCSSLYEMSIDPKLCTGCMVCLRNCPAHAITGAKQKPHVLDKKKCIKCNICYTLCKFDAVKKE